MVLGVENVQNARGRHGCVEHMVAPQASVQAALGQCASRTNVVLVLGGEWSGVAGLRYGLGRQKSAQCLRQAMLR